MKKYENAVNRITQKGDTLIKQNNLTIERITKAMLFHSGEPFATSTQIAKNFGIRHDDLLRKIRLFHSFEELISLRKITERKRTVRGKEYPYFELDADAFAFICLSITGKKAESFKWVFIEAFKKATLEAITAKVSISANQANQNWLEARQHGKDTRELLTQKIKEFCQYAEAQRGKQYKQCPYFKHVTDAIYAFIGVEAPKGGQAPRNVYSGAVVEDIESAEFEAIKLLDEVMDVQGSRKGIKKLIVEHLRRTANR